MKFMKGMKKGEKGFTLIELLVVVAILGILAAVAIPNLASFMNKGKTEAAATELSIVQTAVVAYMADHSGAVPADVAAVVSDGYLLDTPHGTYTINGTTGEVTQTAYP